MLNKLKDQIWKIAATCDPGITPVKAGRMKLIRAEVQEALNMIETAIEEKNKPLIKRLFRRNI